MASNISDQNESDIMDENDQFNIDQESLNQQRQQQQQQQQLARKLKKNKDRSDDHCFFRFTHQHPIISVILLAIILIVIILVIVLPVTLVKKEVEKPVDPRCPDGITEPFVDCLGDREKLMLEKANLENTCRDRKCCWSGSGSNSGGPNCVYPSNYGFRHFKIKENSFTNYRAELVRMQSPESAAKSDISNLEVRIQSQTDSRLHVKIYPRRNYKNKLQRWEVPNTIRPETVFKPLYSIKVSPSSEVPFSLKITRNNTNTTIFDTSYSSLIFSDQFLQLTTKLSSPYIFGIGENGKETFMQDMNYKTWPLFASQNHPVDSRDKPNLYSQFPMYLNIEPDGNSHVVVFHNSNPSEFYLTPNPSLTFRSIGGIFDIFIFMGPTPVQALEQYQQAFGMPKLPPLWSLGLQIGAKNYLNSLMMKSFVKSFKDLDIPFDSVFLGTEHLKEGSMFTLSNHFWDLKGFVDDLRKEHRAIILKWIPAITNTTQNYPFSEGVSRKRYWILENFFSTGVTGKLKTRNVLYPDYTMQKTKEWWHDALQRYIVTDRMITFDGIFIDYLSPLNDKLNQTCPNNKWNYPPYLPHGIHEPIFNGTICMDSRHDISKHYNIHGLHSHYMIDETAKTLDKLLHNRTLLMSRHGFIGTGKHSAKWLGEYGPRWEDFRKSLVSTFDMTMFGFSMSGGDICGFSGDLQPDVCENWIKAGGMSPMMKLMVDDGTIDDMRYESFKRPEIFDVLNSTLYLRYSLIPFFYTELYKATKYGTIPIRPIALQYPQDIRTYKINNQWLWGDKLMVTIGNTAGGLSTTYLPKGEWYDYYRGSKILSRNGENVNVQNMRNETTLHIRGGSVIFKQDCNKNAVDSKNTFVDIIIALDESTNYTASGQLYYDDETKKATEEKDNYHRLIDFNVKRNETDGIISVRRLSGRYKTMLAYRDLIIYGLKSRPHRITVNENSQAIDGSKCVWDELYQAYRVNLQTEVKKKVLLDSEYLSFRWSGGYEYEWRGNNGIGNNNNNNNNRFPSNLIDNNNNNYPSIDNNNNNYPSIDNNNNNNYPPFDDDDDDSFNPNPNENSRPEFREKIDDTYYQKK